MYRGHHKTSGTLVAVKYIDLREFLKAANKIEEIYREAKTLMGLQHRNIIKLYCAFVLAPHDVCLVMEYCEGGELVDWVEERDGLNELEARTIIK